MANVLALLYLPLLLGHFVWLRYLHRRRVVGLVAASW